VPGEYAARWKVADRPEIQFLPRLSDSDLASLYRGSSGVIVASLQEGFGLPIIEAFGFHVPVITSNRDPMREIAGNAAILVNPLDYLDISSAMAEILTKPDLATVLTRKGDERLRDFAGERMANKLLSVYQV
jgi:glycosyltransferase involved in cell wall biosynthesis